MISRPFFALLAIIIVQFYNCASQDMEERNILLLQNVIRYLDNFTHEFTDLHQKVSEMNQKIDASADAHMRELHQKVSEMNEKIDASADAHMRELHQKVSEMNEKIDASANAHMREMQKVVSYLEVSIGNTSDALENHFSNEMQTLVSNLEVNLNNNSDAIHERLLMLNLTAIDIKESIGKMELDLSRSLIGESVVCPEGYKFIGGRWIHFQNSEKTYQESLNDCQTNGGQLLKVDNEELWREVASYLRDNSLGSHWIGLDDRTSEGNFRYVDGTAWNEVSAIWGAEEPNNDGDEDCILFEARQDYKLNDMKCITKHKAICQSLR